MPARPPLPDLVSYEAAVSTFAHEVGDALIAFVEQSEKFLNPTDDSPNRRRTFPLWFRSARRRGYSPSTVAMPRRVARSSSTSAATGAAGSPIASSTSILGALATSRRFRRRRSTAPPRIRAVSVASGRRSREALHALIALMRPIP